MTTQLHDVGTSSCAISSRQLERLGSWQGQRQTSAEDALFTLYSSI